MPLVGAATPEHAIPNFGLGDRPALDLSPGLLDITALLDQLLPPVGSILSYGGDNTGELPPGWPAPDGGAISRTAWPKLFARFGVKYGAGDGSTTFNLPDLRGRSITYKGTNVAVNALGLNDGVAVANRRGELHRHTPHTHVPASGTTIVNTGATYNLAVTSAGGSTQPLAAVDGGSGVATDPLDGGAFIVLNAIVRAS